MSDQYGYVNWLRRRAWRGVVSSLALAPVALALGAGVVILMYFAFVAAIVTIAYHCGVHISRAGMTAVAIAFIVVLFVEYVRQSSGHTEEYSFVHQERSSLLHMRGRRALGLLYPGQMRNAATFILGFLFIGPWLVTSSIRLIGKAYRLATLDAEACAAVIALLHARGQKVPYIEIVAQLPLLDLQRVVDHLHFVDGVLFLRTEPPGLALSSRLMANLNKARASWAQ